MADPQEEFLVLEVDSCERTCRMLTYVLESILFFGGAIAFGTCVFVWNNKDVDNWVGALDLAQYLDAITALMVGIMVLMTSNFFGCTATYFWNFPLMIMYLVLLVISFGINLTASVYVLEVGTHNTHARQIVRDKFAEQMYNYGSDMDAKTTIDTIQYNLGCCGAAYPTDWMKIHMWVPDTCRDVVTGNTIHMSCSEMVALTMETFTAMMAGISFIVCFLQLFGVYFMSVQMAGILRRRRAVAVEEAKD